LTLSAKGRDFSTVPVLASLTPAVDQLHN